MTRGTSPSRSGANGRFGKTSSMARAGKTASTVKNRWRGGEVPDLAAVLESHPELRDCPSHVLDLAFEEFRIRRQAGESLQAEEFAGRFPSMERSIALLIAAHGRLDGAVETRRWRRRHRLAGAGQPFPGLRTDRGDRPRGLRPRLLGLGTRALGERLVALKVATEGGQEAEILGKLQHPNIVPVYSVQQDEETGLTAFCMPYLGQATLAMVLDEMYAGHRAPARARAILAAIHAVNRGTEPPASAAPDRILRTGSFVEGVVLLAAELADALAHTHAHGIFHRDLKPSNVLLTPTGRPLLLDFNLALDGPRPIWKIGGTLPYMPPEELAAVCETGRPEDCPAVYSPASDLFSLGVIVYELLTGNLPFGSIECDCPVEEAARRLIRRQAAGPRPLRAGKRGSIRGWLGSSSVVCAGFAVPPKIAAELAPLCARNLPCPGVPRALGRHASTADARGLRRPAGGGRGRGRLLRRSASLQRPAVPPGARLLPVGQRRIGNRISECLDSRRRALPGGPASACPRPAASGKLPHGLRGLQIGKRVGYRPPACCLPRILPEPTQPVRYGGRLLSGGVDAGYDSPPVLNNFGYCLLRSDQLDEAEAYLQCAIQGDGRLQVAYHNLVIVFARRGLEGQELPQEALAYAARAIELGPESAELYKHAAQLHAIAAEDDSTQRAAAIGFVAKAVALGADRRSSMRTRSSPPCGKSLPSSRPWPRLPPCPTRPRSSRDRPVGGDGLVGPLIRNRSRATVGPPGTWPGESPFAPRK